MRLSREVAVELHTRYLAGERIPDLAEGAGVSIQCLYWTLRKYGLKLLPTNRIRITLESPRAQALIALWDAGATQKGAEKELHMGRATATRILRESGRDPGRRRAGEHHPMWKGGRIVHPCGYIFLRCTSEVRELWGVKNYIAEHRLVMAEHLGRPIRDDETVHHINGIRDDNRLENLQLRSAAHGQGAAMRCAECGSTDLEPVELLSDAERLEACA